MAEENKNSLGRAKKLPEYNFSVSPKEGLHQKLQPFFIKMTVV